jgi:hypothetical protein
LTSVGTSAYNYREFAAKEHTMTEKDNPIEAALNQLLQERLDLDAAIRALQKRLGQPVSSSPSASNGGFTTPGPARPVGEPVVYRGEFYGLSATKAAQKLLKRVNRPLKTPEIFEAFQKAGFEMKAKTPRSNIYTALSRSKDFVRVLPDTWGLAEWHPEIAAAKQDAAKAVKPRKRGRPKGSRSKVADSTETAEPAA